MIPQTLVEDKARLGGGDDELLFEEVQEAGPSGLVDARQRAGEGDGLVEIGLTESGAAARCSSAKSPDLGPAAAGLTGAVEAGATHRRVQQRDAVAPAELGEARGDEGRAVVELE